MEENGIQWELNSVNSSFVFFQIMEVSFKALAHLSSLSSDPLFSCLITLCILLLLYFPPHIFFSIIFSPVLTITGLLLFSLLRLGATQRFETRPETKGNIETNRVGENTGITEPDTYHFSLHQIQDRDWVTCRTEKEDETDLGFNRYPIFEQTFVQWNVRAPLEVIHEAYEDEDAEIDSPNPEEEFSTRLEIYPSLSLYYPETDSDSSSDSDFPVIGDWNSPESIGFNWEEEDREELIEIALDRRDKHDTKQRDLDFHGDEENLIEIDISLAPKTP